MGNALGGMTFVVFGIGLGYLILTGRMTKILTGSNSTTPQQNPTAPPSTPPPAAPVVMSPQSPSGMTWHL